MYPATVLFAVAIIVSAQAAAQNPPKVESEQDPFADLSIKPQPPPSVATTKNESWLKGLFTDNFGFRKEAMSQFTVNESGDWASRQSVGFEVLKKFSTGTATVASFNFQGRMVRRDGFNPVQNDMEGEHRLGWAFEYHNVYLDLYNVLNPLLGDEQKKKNIGRFNLRAGRFYVPFGLNLQTDTHGTLLQLSNERNFGFERDWYTGLWGSLNKHLNYDAYYLAGSGYDLTFQGQRGLGALRISLANKYSNDYGLEGGFSILGGERLSLDRSKPGKIETRRVGVDGRYRHAVPTGLVTFTNEFSGGQDARNSVFTQLHQADYTNSSRRWGVAAQYRRFHEAELGADASLIAEATWYFRNDVGNSNLHWIKANIERRLERMRPQPPSTVISLQYYYYK